MIANSAERGLILCERLGLPIIGREGHDAKCACINCDSSDGFRVHRDSGVAYCFVCQAKYSRLELATKLLGDKSAAWRLLEEIGLEQPRANCYHGSNGSAPTTILDRIAREKHVTADSLKVYGAKIEADLIRLPVYGPTGAPCSSFTLKPGNGKGLFEADKPAGLFFPHNEDGSVRTPKPSETWILVEGVKDAAALHALERLACGLNTSQLAKKFARLFRGVKTVIIPDRDRAGTDGAEKTAALLTGAASLVSIAVLPAELKESKGADVRDVLKEPGGRELVLQSLEDAQPWSPPNTGDGEEGDSLFSPITNGIETEIHDNETTAQDHRSVADCKRARHDSADHGRLAAANGASAICPRWLRGRVVARIRGRGIRLAQ